MSTERVVIAEHEIHQLNDESKQFFASKYKDSNKDVLFLSDGTAHVVVRMSMLCFHGNNSTSQKVYDSFRRIEEVNEVYCGLENETYSLGDYARLLYGVYRGRRARVKSLWNVK